MSSVRRVWPRRLRFNDSSRRLLHWTMPGSICDKSFWSNTRYLRGGIESAMCAISLSPMLRFSRFVRVDSCDGTCLNLLLRSRSDVTCCSWLKDDGSERSKLLRARRSLRLTRFPTLAGRTVSWLWLTSRMVNWVMLPTAFGSDDSRLWEQLNSVRRRADPMLSGKFAILLSAMFNTSRLVKWTKISGRTSSMLWLTSRRVKRVACSRPSNDLSWFLCRCSAVNGSWNIRGGRALMLDHVTDSDSKLGSSKHSCLGTVCSIPSGSSISRRWTPTNLIHTSVAGLVSVTALRIFAQVTDLPSVLVFHSFISESHPYECLNAAINGTKTHHRTLIMTSKEKGPSISAGG